MEHATLGARIRAARKLRGMTALALASSVGVTENAIRKIESGSSHEPRFSTGLRIAHTLRVNPEDLLAELTAEAPVLLDAVATIRKKQAVLEEAGVAHLSIFGSVARGDASPGSDVDIVIEVKRGRRFSLIDQIRVGELLERLLQTRVDILTARTLRRAPFCARARREAVRVF